MDTTLTVGDLAEITGVAAPTIRRALDPHVARTSGGHRRVSAAVGRRVVQEVGVWPRVEGLTPSEVQVLAALARSPAGFRSVRAAARAAGVAPTTASRALPALVAKGFATSTDEQVAAGRVTEVTTWRLLVDDPWFEVAAEVLRARPPVTHRIEPSPRRVPRRFWHHFWTGDPASLRLPENAEFVARRLIESGDLAAAGWAVRHLSADALKAASRARGWSSETRALARNGADHG